MSSISVLWQRAGLATQRLHESMLTAQEMYGPDRRFTWNDHSIALGGNQLSLLPEDRFDRQPLWTADRSACLVADLRLDNRGDLARELGVTHPEELADAEILLAAWTRWGSECLHHILGGFAFAVWTPARQQLFAARDHAGERPLFYHHSADLFALASMPKGLLALSPHAFPIDETHLAHALVLMQPDRTKSFFRGIERLPPGHWLQVTPDGLKCASYWHPSDAPATRYKRDEEYVEAFLEIFDQATAARLRSSKPIAAELSSGLDSSAVASSAARLLARSGQTLTAFTAVPRPDFHGTGFQGRLVDEGPGAADVARLYPNMHHILVDTAGYDLLPTLQRVTDALDEPVQNGVNQLWVAAILDQARARGIGVMLQGALGNTTISYTGTAAFAEMFRRGHWFQLARAARRMRANGFMSIRGALSLATSGLAPDWLRSRLNPDVVRFTLDYSAVNPTLAAQKHLLERMRAEFFAPSPDEKTVRARFFERFDTGPLNAATRALSGIDPRDPCGDKRVFDFCYSIPLEQYIVGDLPRSLIRRAMRGRLPQSTLTRTLRGQQGADWPLTVAAALPSFRAELQRIQTDPLAHRMLDLPRIERLLNTWPSSGYEVPEVWNSWNDALCRGISCGYFLRTHHAPGSALPARLRVTAL